MPIPVFYLKKKKKYIYIYKYYIFYNKTSKNERNKPHYLQQNGAVLSSLSALKYTRWSFPLLTSCWGLSDPSFPIKRVLGVAGVSNQTSSITSYLTWLDHSQHPCLVWGTHCASSQRDSSRSDSGRRTGFSLGSSVQAWLSVWGTCWQMWTSKKSSFKKSALTFPCLAGSPSLSRTSSFSSGDFLGIIGYPLL